MKRDPAETSDAELSIVLLMSRRYDWLRRTILAWADETREVQIEAIIVRPERLREARIVEEDLKPFVRWSTVEIPELDTVGTGFAAGVAHASAPIVMLAEDHAFPDRGLARAILDVYDDDPEVVAVGPAMYNANPGTVASEASFLLPFSYVAWPERTCETRALGGHNASYRTAYLRSFGDDLAHLYAAERVLQFEIEAQGRKMILLADHRMGHYNFSRFSAMITHAYVGGRLFGAKRSHDWGVARRLLHAAAIPLVPIVRLRRILRDLQASREDRARVIPKRLPVVVLALAIHATGEWVGYLFGIGRAAERYAPFELYRRDQLNATELEAIDASVPPAEPHPA